MSLPDSSYLAATGNPGVTLIKQQIYYQQKNNVSYKAKSYESLAENTLKPCYWLKSGAMTRLYGWTENGLP